MSNDLVPVSGNAVATVVQPTQGPLPGTTVDMARKVAAAAMKPSANTTPATRLHSDQEIDDDFVKALTAKGHSSAQAKDALEAIKENETREDQVIAYLDKQDLAACTAALQARWGSSYAKNKRAALTAFRALPVVIQDALQSGTLADNTLALHTEAAWRWLHELSTKPVNAGGGDGGGGGPDSVGTELATLRKMMADKTGPYWKGRDAARNQARYKQLVEQGGK